MLPQEKVPEQPKSEELRLVEEDVEIAPEIVSPETAETPEVPENPEASEVPENPEDGTSRPGAS